MSLLGNIFNPLKHLKDTVNVIKNPSPRNLLDPAGIISNDYLAGGREGDGTAGGGTGGNQQQQALLQQALAQYQQRQQQNNFSPGFMSALQAGLGGAGQGMFPQRAANSRAYTPQQQSPNFLMQAQQAAQQFQQSQQPQQPAPQAPGMGGLSSQMWQMILQQLMASRSGSPNMRIPGMPTNPMGMR